MPLAVEFGVDDVLHVLRNVYGLEGVINHDELRIQCPSPKHEDTHASCDVNLVTGLWSCFSCQAQGDLASLGRMLLSRSRTSVIKLLSPNEPTAIAAAIQARSKSYTEVVHQNSSVITSLNALTSTDTDSSNYRDAFPKELKRRGFTKKQCKKWGIKFVDEQVFESRSGERTYLIDNAIGIPIISEEGDTILWCYRATPSSSDWWARNRYFYTPGLTDTIKSIWFGLDHHRRERHITVTEGALDAMWLDQHGIPALAILGSNVTAFEKLERLRGFRSVTIFTDRDNAGAQAADNLGAYLIERGTPVRIVLYPRWARKRTGNGRANDPQDVCGLDLELMWERAVPFATWQMRARQRGANS